jgi:hypothetical protein
VAAPHFAVAMYRLIVVCSLAAALVVAGAAVHLDYHVIALVPASVAVWIACANHARFLPLRRAGAVIVGTTVDRSRTFVTLVSHRDKRRVVEVAGVCDRVRTGDVGVAFTCGHLLVGFASASWLPEARVV